MLAVDYLAAQAAMRQSRAEFDAALAGVDAIVAPSTPMAAPPIGAERVRLDEPIDENSDSVRGALVRLNRPANFTGLPAISIPCGFTPNGLPAGLQLIGRAFDESTLLHIAGSYEGEHDWRFAHPQLAPVEPRP